LSHKITAERRQMIVNWVFKNELCGTNYNVSNKVLMRVYKQLTGNHALKSNVCSCLWAHINTVSNFKGCKPVETKPREKSKPKSKPKSKKYVDFYSSKRWKKLRIKAFEKYGRHCILCNRTPEADGIVLTVHHTLPRSKNPESEYDITNLQILCEECHKRINKYVQGTGCNQSIDEI